jgi:glycosyltransferase involved in cell wall biosynthesis
MKIAFVYDAIYPWVKGGAEKRIYELGKRLVQKGHRVHVFGVKWWDGADMITNKGMVLHGVCGKMDLYIHGRRSITEAVIFSIKLMPHLYKEKFDLIDVSVFPYISCFSVKLIYIFRRTPVIFTWHEVWGDYWYEYMGKIGAFGKLVEIMVSKLTSRSIVVSEMTKNGLESLGMRDENMRIVPNGIDLEMIDSIPPSVHKCDIIFVGRLIREKNVDILIEAIVHVKRSLPDIKCHIIGNGPEKEKLKRIVIECKLQNNVSFFGFLDYDEVIARIKSSNVLVIPSSREGFGMVIIEAYACGVPVITVKCPGNAAEELVNERTGLIVELNENKLAEAVLKMVTDDVLRKRLSGSALKAAAKFDWDEITGKLMSYYEEKK